MKIKYIIIGFIAIISIMLPSIVQADTFGDTTCKYYGYPINVYICSDNKTFFSYSVMNNYYTPVLEEIFVPETTYLYVTGGATETFSGT